jgi:acyl carrier protein
MSDPKEAVRQFIISNFYVANPDDLKDETSLLDSGMVDSTGVLEVIAFLESEFGVKVADAEIVPDNLDGVARIAAFIERKGGKAVAK